MAFIHVCESIGGLACVAAKSNLQKHFWKISIRELDGLVPLPSQLQFQLVLLLGGCSIIIIDYRSRSFWIYSPKNGLLFLDHLAWHHVCLYIRWNKLCSRPFAGLSVSRGLYAFVLSATKNCVLSKPSCKTVYEELSQNESASKISLCVIYTAIN